MRPAPGRCATRILFLTAVLMLHACQPRAVPPTTMAPTACGGRFEATVRPGTECWPRVPGASGGAGGALEASPGGPDAAGWSDPLGDRARQRPGYQSALRGAARYVPLWGRDRAARFPRVCGDLGWALCGPRAGRYRRLGGDADSTRILRRGAGASVTLPGRILWRLISL